MLREGSIFEMFKNFLELSKKNVNNWNTNSEFQNIKIAQLKEDIQKFEKNCLCNMKVDKEYFWDELYKWVEENLTHEGVEYIVSLMMEPYDNIISLLVPQMSSDEDKYFDIPANRTTDELRSSIEKSYPDIIRMDFSIDKSNENFWYISKNKEEPRLARRFHEPGSELEQPLAIARDIKKLYETIFTLKNSLKIGNFLVQNNDLRHIVRRVFITEKYPYSEIQDNTIGSKLVPIDMLRLKLSFFGAVKFDPRSDKWLRICMFQGAPLPNELNSFNQLWIYN